MEHAGGVACEPVNTAVIHEHAEYAREEAGEGEMKRMPKPGQLSGPVHHSNAARRRALISRKLLMNELMPDAKQEKKEGKEV